jgi:cytidylate kinase
MGMMSEGHPLRITIAGDIGSGKSTIAKRLADLAGREPLSTGGIQRQLAQARGLTVLELNKLAEQDPSIDQEIDGYLIRLEDRQLVVESRMAWHFVPETLKLYLYISDGAAARRIIGAQRIDEHYGTIANAIQPIMARRRSEIIRFRKYYNVDIDDLRNYDLVIDTTFATVEEVVAEVRQYKRLEHDPARKPACLIDPRNLVPTRRLTLDDSAPDTTTAEPAMTASLVTLYVDHVFYVVEGHARAAAAVRRGTRFVACSIAASNDEAYIRGLTARQHIRSCVDDALVHDWEAAVGFQYQEEMWKGRAGDTRRGKVDTRA